MKLRVVLRPLVPSDLLEITAYLDQQGPLISQWFLDSVRATLEWLTEFPGAGSPKHFRSRNLAGLRTWPVREFGEYLIFYWAIREAVVVLAILHGRRNLPKALRGRT